MKKILLPLLLIALTACPKDDKQTEPRLTSLANTSWVETQSYDDTNTNWSAPTTPMHWQFSEDKITSKEPKGTYTYPYSYDGSTLTVNAGVQGQESKWKVNTATATELEIELMAGKAGIRFKSE